MDTLIIKDINSEALETAGEIIRRGGTVCFPTETVYGLGASAYDEDAIAKIYEAKGRPSDNPLIVHIPDVSEVYKVAREVPDSAKKLFEAFAPGPFTLILKKNPEIADRVTAGLDTVGVRIPSHPVARDFLKAAGVPVAAPSSNISGKPSPTKAEHVIADMDTRVDAIICGGASDVGVESTIIDMTEETPVILRPGGITPEDIKRVLGDVKIDRHVLESVNVKEQPKCPGMKYKHYAPDADVTVVSGKIDATETKIAELVAKDKQAGKQVGVLARCDKGYNADCFIASGKDNSQLARVLFDALRQFDKENIDTCYVQFTGDDGISLAVKNRLFKAAGNKVIYTEE
ncbi:MAG: threonylcarbamoyl-AMP synthase [Clostridia bacterium]|nr:threonylcarbamoyl-AMP synthase [Clostridia bacterium]